MAICEVCKQEKNVTDIEGNLLCDECAEDVVRCAFCNRLIATSYDVLENNFGILDVPELTLPDKGQNLIFCDVNCLDEYIQKYKKSQKMAETLAILNGHGTEK